MTKFLFFFNSWSGHIAFPGGKNEEMDKTAFDTVVRECKEETGLDLSSPDFILLGTLDPIVLTSLKTRNPTMRLIPHSNKIHPIILNLYANLFFFCASFSSSVTCHT